MAWFNESKRHGLASQGVKTGRKIQQFARSVVTKGKELLAEEKKLYPKQLKAIRQATDVVAEQLEKAREYEKLHYPEQKKFVSELLLLDGKKRKEPKVTGDETFSEWMAKKGQVEEEPSEEEQGEELVRQQILREQLQPSNKVVVVAERPEDVKVVGTKQEVTEDMEQETDLEEKPKFAKDFDRGIFDY